MNTPDSLRWLTPGTPPLQVCGLEWFDVEGRWRRLPASPVDPLPPAVDGLANNLAGGQIRFRTDAATVRVRVRLAQRADMDHMPAVGQAGVDFYVDGAFAGCARLQGGQKDYEAAAGCGAAGSLREILINLPLYQSVESLEVGLPEAAALQPPTPFRVPGVVVFYGTSITQGGCANRPGMAHTNILSRRLGVEVINLGFSGSGKGEPAVARCVAAVRRPALFVLDYVANAGVQGLRDTCPAFVDTIRAAHPLTPILALDRIRFAGDRFNPDAERDRQTSSDFLLGLVAERAARGDRHITFFSMADAMGADWDECTVDGVHPTDLGFMRMADALTPVLARLLAESTTK